MTLFIPHPEIFHSLLVLLSRRGYWSEAQGGSRRVSSFTVFLAVGLLQWKRMIQDGLCQKAMLQRELIINTLHLVCSRRFGYCQPYVNIKLLKQLDG